MVSRFSSYGDDNKKIISHFIYSKISAFLYDLRSRHTLLSVDSHHESDAICIM